MNREELIGYLREYPSIPIDNETLVYIRKCDDSGIAILLSGTPSASLISALRRILPNEIRDRVEFVIGDPLTDDIPLYRSGIFLLPELDSDITLSDLSVKPIKIRNKKQNYTTFEELWNSWCSRYINDGILLSKHRQGIQTIIWKIGDTVSILINGIDYSNNLKQIKEEILSTFREHDVCFDATIIAIDTKSMKIKSSEIKIEGLPIDPSFLLNSAIEDTQEDSLVVLINDLLYLDKPLNNIPLYHRLLQPMLQTVNKRFLLYEPPILVNSISTLIEGIERLSPNILLRHSLMLYPTKGNNKTIQMAYLTLSNDVNYTIKLTICPFIDIDTICKEGTCNLSTDYICPYLTPDYYGIENNTFKSLQPSHLRYIMSDSKSILDQQSITRFNIEETLSDKLRISGILLAPGQWNNLWFYPEHIKEMYDTYKDKLSTMDTKVSHSITKKYGDKIVGSGYNIKWDDILKAIIYSTDITDPDAIEDIKSGKYLATSLKLRLNIDVKDGLRFARDIEPIDNSLVDLPACKTCRITYYQDMSDGQREMGYYGVIDTNDSVELKENDGMSEDGVCPFYKLDSIELSVLRFDESHFSGPKASIDTPWSFSSSDYTLEELREACIIVMGDPDNKTSYKLPHHLPDGTLVWRGVDAAIKALKGARGGVIASDSDKQGAFRHLEKHAKQFDKEVEPLSESVSNTVKCYFCNEETDDIAKHLLSCSTLIDMILKSVNVSFSEASVVSTDPAGSISGSVATTADGTNTSTDNVVDSILPDQHITTSTPTIEKDIRPIEIPVKIKIITDDSDKIQPIDVTKGVDTKDDKIDIKEDTKPTNTITVDTPVDTTVSQPITTNTTAEDNTVIDIEKEIKSVSGNLDMVADLLIQAERLVRKKIE